MRSAGSDEGCRVQAAAKSALNRAHVAAYAVILILAALVVTLPAVMPRLAAMALFFACALMVSWLKPFLAFSCFMLLLPFHNFARRLLSSQLLVSETNLAYASLWKEMLLLAIIVAVVLRKTLDSESRAVRLYTPDIWLAALLIFGAAYVPLAASPEIGVFGFRNYFAAFAVFYVVRLLPFSRASLKRLLIAMLLVAVIVGVFGTLQANLLGFEFLQEYGFADESGGLPTVYKTRYRPDYPRAASTLSGPNEFGAYMALMALVTVAALSSSERWGSRAWYSVCLASLIPGLAFSFSRSALGMLVVGLLAPPASELLRRRKRLRFRIRMGQVVLILLVLLLIAVVGYKIGLMDRILGALTVMTKSVRLLGRDLTGGVLEDPSAKGKLESAAYAVAFVLSHPLGTGMGMAGPRAASRFGTEVSIEHSESTYLQLAMELGIVGLFLYVGLCACVVSAIHKMRVEAEASKTQRFIDLALGATVGTMVAYLFIPLAQNFVFACYLWFVIGIAFRVRDLSR